MILNYGNIKTKSRILKYYIFDIFCHDVEFRNDYLLYEKTILAAEQFKSYNEINRYLHDARIIEYHTGKNIIFKLSLWKDEINSRFEKYLCFTNAKIISLNKILKSGKIARYNNRYYHPIEYLYDEIYYHNEENYITIICEIESEIKAGYAFPLLTLQFQKIEIMDSLPGTSSNKA